MSETTARALMMNPLRAVLGRPAIALLAGAVVLGQLLTILPIPFIVSHIFDDAIPNADRTALVGSGVLVILLFVVGATSTFLLQSRMAVVSQKITRAARERLVARVHELSLADVKRRGHHDLFDLLVLETDRIAGAISITLTQLVPAIVLIVGLSVVLVFIDWPLFLVSAAFAPVMIGLNWMLATMLRRRLEHLNETRRRHNAGVHRILSTFPLARVSGAEEHEQDRQRDLIGELESASVRWTVVSALNRASQQSIVIASALATLIVGGLRVIDGAISLGTLFSFYAGIALLRPSLDRVVQARPALTAGRVAAQRFDEFFAAADPLPWNGTSDIDFTGRIAVDAVEFGYRPDTTVVGPVSFVLEPGELTVLTGPNGSGKSTVVDLLCGFHRPTRGSMTVEGTPMDDVDVASLRRRTGVVFQDPYLLEDSIDANLRFGAVHASDEDIELGCRLAMFDEILSSLPQGGETVLGSTDHTLSGGQAQRLAIARAVGRRPSLLLLDEPTNHLDVLTLERVLANLRSLDPAPAVVVVTHDHRVIEAADLLIELPHPDLRVRGMEPTVGRRADA